MKTIKMPLLVAAVFAALTSSTNAQSWLTNGLVAYYPFDGNANNAVNGSQAVVFAKPGAEQSVLFGNKSRFISRSNASLCGKQVVLTGLLPGWAGTRGSVYEWQVAG